MPKAFLNAFIKVESSEKPLAIVVSETELPSLNRVSANDKRWFKIYSLGVSPICSLKILSKVEILIWLYFANSLTVIVREMFFVM